jgi:hypothetical protein
MVGPGICLAFSILVGPPQMMRGSVEKPSSYVGWAQCETCHEDISKAWQFTRHARAMDSLKKSKQENLPACVKCHVTGFDQDGGFVDYELTPEMAGVQCEECHGPGSNHVKNPAEEATRAKTPGVDLCRKCHTEKQDPGFSYEKKSAEVHMR